MSRVSGIHVNQDTLEVVVMSGTQYSAFVRLPNTGAGYQQLMRWLDKHANKGCAVCLETTGRYIEVLSEVLYAAGFCVSVADPEQLREYARKRRNKTEKLDAKLIADFCRSQKPEAWTPPSAEIRQLQALERHLIELEEAHQQVADRLRNQIDLPEIVVKQLHDQNAILVQHIEQAKKLIQDHIDQHPQLRGHHDLINSNPGSQPGTSR